MLLQLTLFYFVYERAFCQLISRRKNRVMGQGSRVKYYPEGICWYLFPLTLDPYLSTRRAAVAGGTYFLSIRESDTTVTELMAMASPANSGFNVIPKNG
jgi:hypothetical protein